MTTALVVDDHPIVLQGCRQILRELGVAEVQSATGVVAGYRAFLRCSPDLVIVDLTFERDDLGGLSLISRIASADKKVRILVFSMHEHPTIVARALEAGASGYVLKDAPSDELSAAIEKVLAGASHLSHTLAMQVAMLRSKGGQGTTKDLTGREMQVLTLLGRGNSYDQIAAKLGVSYKTVTNVCSNMRSKLKMASLAELIRFAIKSDPLSSV